MRLKLLSAIVGATLVAGLGTVPQAQADVRPNIIGGITVPEGGAPWGNTINGAPINGQAYFGDSGGPMVHNGQEIGTCTGPVGGGGDPSRLTVAYQNIPRRAAWIQQITGIRPGGQK